MQRDIEVSVDAGSWPGGTVPPALSGAATMGTWSCCVETAILSVALHTRSPIVEGFHLSDWWAWLRYLPALADTPELRLRDEWTATDSHQKAVLSDDFGVGFATWFLIEHLQFLAFVETSHFLWCVAPPGAYFLLNCKKAGPNKIPDYVGLDDQLRLSVLECKGSQADRRVLRQTIAKGIPQKQNFRTGIGLSEQRRGSTVQDIRVEAALASEIVLQALLPGCPFPLAGIPAIKRSHSLDQFGIYLLAQPMDFVRWHEVV